MKWGGGVAGVGSLPGPGLGGWEGSRGSNCGYFQPKNLPLSCTG